MARKAKVELILEDAQLLDNILARLSVLLAASESFGGMLDTIRKRQIEELEKRLLKKRRSFKDLFPIDLSTDVSDECDRKLLDQLSLYFGGFISKDGLGDEYSTRIIKSIAPYVSRLAYIS